MKLTLDRLSFGRHSLREISEWSVSILGGTFVAAAGAVSLGLSNSIKDVYKKYYATVAISGSLLYLFKTGAHQLLDERGYQQGTMRELSEWSFAILTSFPLTFAIAFSLGWDPLRILAKPS